MNILVGYTGFVGSNLNTQHHFDNVFNSQNIEDAFETDPDLCVYAGIRAEKFLADNNPDADRREIENAVENIRRIHPSRLVLISTVDVFRKPINCDEDTLVNTDGISPYGLNRYKFELLSAEIIDDCYIVRLPGLFGKNMKKNFIYDMLHIIPSMLNQDKFEKFSAQEPLISECYAPLMNGFYKCVCKDEEKNELKRAFERLHFSALNFTDSRAVFQFYNISCLWRHIQTAMQNNIKLLHLAVEPLSVKDIYAAVKRESFANEYALPEKIPHYDFKTKYAELFGGGEGYIFNKQKVLQDILDFVSHGNEQI